MRIDAKKIATLFFIGVGFICAAQRVQAKWDLLRSEARAAAKKNRPRMLVFPFTCANEKISGAMEKAFLQEVHSQTETIAYNSFDAYLSSYSFHLPEHMYVSALDARKKATEERLKDTSAPYTAAPIKSADARLAQELRENAASRQILFDSAQIRFVVFCDAKEHIQTELEEGNIETADVAILEVWDLAANEMLMNESVRQGAFEILAPERMGEKLAAKINRALNELYKEEKRKAKNRAQ